MITNSKLSATLPPLIQAIAQPIFVEACLQCINQVVAIDHLGLFTFTDELTPKLLDGTSLDEDKLTIRLARQYIQYFYWSDPNLGVIATPKSTETSLPLFTKLHYSEITDAFYREQIYERYNLNERLSWLGQVGGIWYALNMYRETKHANIDKDELQQLHDVSPVIIACVEKHISQISPAVWEAGKLPGIEWFEDLIRELGGGLTAREIQVCARALHGLTRNGIALDLDIKATTVNTLTQRAYHKLQISTLNELFALCLRNLALTQNKQTE